LYPGKFRYGPLSCHYFYVDSSGRKKELIALDKYMFGDTPKHKPDTNEIGVWHWETGIGPSPVNESEQYKFIVLIVSSKNNFNRFFDFEYSEAFDSTVTARMRECFRK